MAMDMEVFEADSELALQEELRNYIENNDVDVENIVFGNYTDIETDKLVYSAAIMIV